VAIQQHLRGHVAHRALQGLTTAAAAAAAGGG
jgi:hypothetical protein